MKLSEMRNKVLRCLDHIPTRPQQQSILRELFWQSMMHNYGKGGAGLSPSEVLKLCLSKHPGINFIFDTEFFELPGVSCGIAKGDSISLAKNSKTNN